MAEIGAVAATVAVIRGALEALRGLRDQGLSAEHARAVDDAMDLMRDAQDRVNALQAALIEVREQNYGLRRQIDEHDNWNTRLAEFNLVATPGGAHVYQRGAEGNNLYACPACIEN